MKKIEATLKFKVEFNKPEYNSVYEFRRDKSAAFEYGNGTAVTLYRNGEFEGIIDTWYDRKVMGDFRKWCNDYLGDMFDPAYEPVIMEV